MACRVTTERLVLASSHSSAVLGSLSGCLKWWAEVATSAVGAVVEGIVFIVGRAGLVVVGVGSTTSRQVGAYRGV